MILRDLHVHTTYCDGINTPEEMVLTAIQKGMECLGFSAHSYTFFDESYCMKMADDYKHEIARLKEKYKDKIKILCGVEQDFYSEEPTDGYDYVIGSVHYIKIGKNYIPIDESAQILIDAANKYFGGDFYKLADTYYKTVAQIKNADIIGHFDLITKFNEGFCLFDENDERYEKSYKETLDILLRQDVYFEIVDEMYGYNQVEYSGYLSLPENEYQIQITVSLYFTGNIVYEITEKEESIVAKLEALNKV